MDSNLYLIVFDTNVLYVNYENVPNFSDFSFSGTFNSFLDEIEELDIYDIVSVSIPDVVWQESKQQNIEAYNKKITDILNAHKKTYFPFHKLVVEENRNYEDFLDSQIKSYQEGLMQRQVKVESLSLPSNNRYDSIIKRALDKRPPFEGKDKKSDKGFKDVLLWESIIEHKIQHPETRVILYTNDSIFNNELKQEYLQTFKEDILICGSKNESELHDLLNNLAMAKDSTIPISKNAKMEELKEFIFSNDFSDKLTWFCSGLIGNNFYITLDKADVISVDYIKDWCTEEPEIQEYEVALTSNWILKTRDGKMLEQEKKLNAYVQETDNGYELKTVGNIPTFTAKRCA